jgi:hypothetical protein
MTAAGVCAVVIVLGAGSAIAVDPNLVPPVSVSPANGAKVKGPGAVFRFRSHPGDDLLWLNVSRSPRREFGVIGDDIIYVIVNPSPDGRYRVKVGGHEFPRGGTYYWQPFRDGDPDLTDDLYIPGAVRSFRYIPPYRLGRYKGRTSQGRSISFRLVRGGTKIAHLNTSTSINCSQGRLVTKMSFANLEVKKSGRFADALSSVDPSGWEVGTVKGKFRSRRRATGTLTVDGAFPGSVGTCGVHRFSWVARHR